MYIQLYLIYKAMLEFLLFQACTNLTFTLAHAITLFCMLVHDLITIYICCIAYSLSNTLYISFIGFLP